MDICGEKASQSLRSMQGNLVLVALPDGSVVNLIEAPAELHEIVAAADEPLSIDHLWPTDITGQIRASIKRTVRSRRSVCDDFEDAADGNGLEFLYVPQGPERALIVVRDLSEQKMALSRARALAYTDEATGLPNREFLFSELQRITDVQRLKEGRAAVICIYVGQIDDHGYALNATQQDEVLTQLARRMTSHLRGSNDDTIVDYERLSIAARADFRQFCVVLPSIENGEDAEAVATRIIDDLTQPVTIARRTLTVHAFAGVALFPQDGTDPAALFENAAAAMEDARNDPGVPCKFHSGTVRLRTLQRQDLEEELRSALEERRYSLNFLPVVDVTSRAPLIVEALLRWPETILGTQPTRRIVQVAERTGLIIPLGEWVLRHACEQLRAWRAAGHEQVRLSVNLSAQELASDSFADRVNRILSETGVEPADLDLEIKEHMLFREALRDYAACNAIDALGVRLVVDDYGIGACSLAQLSQSPVSAIKIDNTFVASVVDSDRERAACAAATAVADKLGIDVIAEGVETEQQARILQEQGCSYQQGFLYSQPLNDADILDYLAEAASRSADADGDDRGLRWRSRVQRK